MFTQAALSGQLLENSQFSPSQDVIQNHRAASVYFRRAKKQGAWRRFLTRLTGRSIALQHLPAAARQNANRAARGVQYIPIDQVIGSEGRSHDFDNEFWPLSDHSRDRWVSIAVAMGTGKPLPPVQLIQVTGGYVVRDGNHRLSVARAFGQAMIEAVIC